MTSIRINTALTILTDIHPRALAVRITHHRTEYETRCRREGRHLPSTDQLDQWFKNPLTQETAR